MKNLDIHVRPKTRTGGEPYLRIESDDGEYAAAVGLHHGVEAEMPYAMVELARHITAVCLGWSVEDDEEGSA